ncbi:MAG TPA: aminotransferase class V-fold PLP-dependent enzyme [Gaiellaceae bacterium]|jgi:L-cysteine/cystine lyase
MTFEEARARFPVLERFAYLNAGSLGPLARPTLEAIAQRARFDQEHGRGGRAWVEDTLALRGRIRERLARLIEAQAERVALTSSTTDGCNIVVAGLDLGPEDEVVTTDSEHPGLLLPLHVSGARVRVAEVAARPTAHALDAILSCVTPRTRLLALSHVLWTTGQVMPVNELKRESGLRVLVDGAQSVGAIPAAIGELDYYTVSCQKWLCGPDPLGALYVRDPEQLRIARPSYFTQKSLERDGTFVPVDGAARFDSGWLAPPALAGLETALDGLPEWRFERAAEMTERCRTVVGSKCELIGESGQGTLVSFVPPGDPVDTTRKLYDAGVIVRDLPGTGWVRASCGWWTSEGDIERLVAGLAH